MSFTDAEIAYLRSQPIARVATLSADGQPAGDTWYEPRRTVHHPSDRPA